MKKIIFILGIPLITGSTLFADITRIPDTPDQVRIPADAQYFLALREPNALTRTRLLYDVAINYARAGNVDATTAVLSLIRQASGSSIQSQAVADISRSFVESNKVTEAQTWINGLKNSGEQNVAKDSMITALINQKNIDAAETIAKTIGNSVIKNRVLIEVADAYARNGNAKAAEGLLTQIQDNGKSEIYVRIVKHYIDNHDIESAKKIMPLISDPIQYQKANRAIINSLSQDGSINEVTQLITSISDPISRQSANAVAAAALISNNKFIDAKPFIDQVQRLSDKDMILSAAAIQYCKARDYDQFERTILQIQDNDLRNDSTYQSAVVSVKDGNLEKAFEVVNRLPEPARSTFLPRLAAEFGKSDQYLFAQLLLKQINPESLKWIALKEHSWELARSNANYSKSIRLLSDAPDQLLRNTGLGGLCDIYLFQRNFELAGQAADMIDFLPARVFWLTAIAKYNPNGKSAEWLNKAMTAAESIDSPADRIGALIQISDGFMAINTPQRARDIVDKARNNLDAVKSSPSYLDLVTQVCAAYERTHISNESLQLIKQLSLPTDRLKVLSVVNYKSVPADLAGQRSDLLRDIAR